MATWEDLDNESGSEKYKTEEEGNVVVGLVATMTSDAESGTNLEDEDEVYSKIPKAELIESLKQFLTHFENKSN